MLCLSVVTSQILQNRGHMQLTGMAHLHSQLTNFIQTHLIHNSAGHIPKTPALCPGDAVWDTLQTPQSCSGPAAGKTGRPFSSLHRTSWAEKTALYWRTEWR